MKAVLQRVTSAAVSVAGAEVAAIGPGLVILLGIEQGDTDADSAWMVNKVARLRIFADENGRMNRSVIDIGGEALVVSQFTLLANTASGNRPDFLRAAAPDEARSRYEAFARDLGGLLGRPVPTGVFGADMQVRLVNDGPVTIVLGSEAGPHRR
jgi:D-tyrosyl-tRNA(Tyr) deacylase